MLKCNVPTTSHYGGNSDFYAEAVDMMAPEYVVVSVGRKPSTDAHAKYAWHAKDVLSTRPWGTRV